MRGFGRWKQGYWKWLWSIIISFPDNDKLKPIIDALLIMLSIVVITIGLAYLIVSLYLGIGLIIVGSLSVTYMYYKINVNVIGD